MKKAILVFLCVFIFLGISAKRYYAQVYIFPYKVFNVNKKMTLAIDENHVGTVSDEHGTPINSFFLSALFTYLGEKGWIYVESIGSEYLFYKDADNVEEAVNGLILVKNKKDLEKLGAKKEKKEVELW